MWTATKTAALTMALFLAGCREDEDCYCQGEELDFTIVGDLAGSWGAGDGTFPFVFDGNHRPRRLHDRSVGCSPGSMPIVLGAHTAGVALTYVFYELIAAELRPGFFSLTYKNASDRILEFEARFEGDLLIEDGDEFTRSSSEPVYTPEERCD